MKSRDIARVGVMVSGLLISSLLVSTSDIARSDGMNASSAGTDKAISSYAGSAVASGRGDYVQRLGCEKASKPTCNKPGRRSTRR